MSETGRPITALLERLEETAGDNRVTVQEVLDAFGRQSFPAVILIPALISASPASAVPGVTAVVAVIVALTVVQMMAGAEHVWMPGFVARRSLPPKRVRQAVNWLRGPVGWLERFLKPRLQFLVRRPGVILPLLVIFAITLFMPLMEVIPTSGSIASWAIAAFAAGLLTRDGALVLMALLIIVALPIVIWQVVW